MFGGNNNKPIFGSSSTPTTGNATSGLFGNNPSTPATPIFGNTGSTTSLFSGNKPASATPATGQSLFGGNTSTTPAATPAAGAGLFGGKSVTFGQTSTTPASNPPSSTAPGELFGKNGVSASGTGGAGSISLFGPSKPAEKSLFTNPTPAADKGPLNILNPSSKPELLFGNPVTKPENKSATPAPTAAPGGLFSPTSTTPATNPPTGFSLFGKPATTSAPATAPSLGSSTPATNPPSSLFGNTASTTTPSTTTATSTAPAAPSLFGNTTSTTSTVPATGAATTTAPAAAPLFGKVATQTANASSTPVIGSLFNKPTTTPATPASTTTTTAPTTTTAAPSLGGGFKAAAPAQAAGTTTSVAGVAAAQPTPPPPQSRLKNKSMEDIIGRWTGDLEKYKAEFKNQADEIKKWDMVLIENGDKIVNLSAATLDAEKTQARMDTVLQQLENEQEELGVTLDYYENQIKEIFEGQFGSGDGMQPADQEREKTYSTAERLNDSLGGMESDLSEMIKTINRAGATINKTTNADDPLSQIVKILNDHLCSLQWIDAHVDQVGQKIQEAQKRSNDRATAGLGGGDDFFPGASFRSMR